MFRYFNKNFKIILILLCVVIATLLNYFIVTCDNQRQTEKLLNELKTILYYQKNNKMHSNNSLDKRKLNLYSKNNLESSQVPQQFIDDVCLILKQNMNKSASNLVEQLYIYWDHSFPILVQSVEMVILDIHKIKNKHNKTEKVKRLIDNMSYSIEKNQEIISNFILKTKNNYQYKKDFEQYFQTTFNNYLNFRDITKYMEYKSELLEDIVDW